MTLAFQRQTPTLTPSFRTSPCPFAPFATIIVNHSDTSLSPHGKMICTGMNQIAETGNPILHGEISALTNCSHIFSSTSTSTSPSLPFSHLTLYTTAEACPMCASAIRWAGLKAYYLRGRPVSGLPRCTGGSVLAEETDGLFAGQFSGGGVECPEGCVRDGDGGDGGMCVVEGEM
ncbi:cytidine and deoxycytidylate deaminase zinc-binding region protein [Rutstroemia sp. NJR-2017a BVV2]|nr:cytidine and deoxycytidylate deaminase zinc-binding region protein [Rutstroemia sp. NJR-2017a BVV2]